MPERMETHESFEPERYELREGPAYEFSLSRREFAGIAGAGLLLTITARPAADDASASMRHPRTAASTRNSCR